MKPINIEYLEKTLNFLLSQVKDLQTLGNENLTKYECVEKIKILKDLKKSLIKATRDLIDPEIIITKEHYSKLIVRNRKKLNSEEFQMIADFKTQIRKFIIWSKTKFLFDTQRDKTIFLPDINTEWKKEAVLLKERLPKKLQMHHSLERFPSSFDIRKMILDFWIEDGEYTWTTNVINMQLDFRGPCNYLIFQKNKL